MLCGDLGDGADDDGVVKVGVPNVNNAAISIHAFESKICFLCKW
jgi:hypothetical protein